MCVFQSKKGKLNCPKYKIRKMSQRLPSLLLTFVCAAGAQPTFYLPEHLRGGEFAAQHPSLVPPPHLAGPKPSFIDVPVDHFNGGTATWKLKYWTTTSAEWSAAKPGPIFIEMPGEGAAGGPPSVRKGSLIDHFNGVGVGLEHRFFGTSIPLNSSTTKALDAYLSVQQNLADIVFLLAHIKDAMKLPANHPVVSLGGSYSGASAAWIRMLYPSQITAAIALSPPIRATLDFRAYDESNAAALASPAPSCRDQTVATMRALDAAIAADEIKTMALFNASHLHATPMGLTDFLYGIADAAASPVQYGQKAVLCSALAAALPAHPTQDEYVEFYANWTLKQYGGAYFHGCFYNSDCMRDAEHAYPAESARSWYHFKCSELGYLQTATPTPSSPERDGVNPSVRPSSLTVATLIAQCNYIFKRETHGVNATQLLGAAIDKFNHKFGGADSSAGLFATASKIGFFDYSDDPWRTASVLKTTRASLPVHLAVCDGCGHCGSGATPSIAKEVAQIQVQLLTAWLKTT